MTNKEAPIYVEKADQDANSPPENPVIVQLKKELAEAMDNEIMAQQLGHNTERWTGYQKGLLRAIKIVEKIK